MTIINRGGHVPRSLKTCETTQEQPVTFAFVNNDLLYDILLKNSLSLKSELQMPTY